MMDYAVTENKRSERTIRGTVLVAALAALLLALFWEYGGNAAGGFARGPEQSFAATKKAKVTGKEVRAFLHKSCFIGNSVMEGRANYTKARGGNYMGRPLFMTRVSYSFLNDKFGNTGFMIKYKGRPMRAKDAIKKSGKSNVFINMGTNDLMGGVASTFRNYKDYIAGIRKVNPKVLIFIESTAPVRTGKGSLNNANIRALNRRLKSYADSRKGIYYVNVYTALADKSGVMKAAYSSDNYVHLTGTGADAWNKATYSYVKNFLLEIKKEEIKKAEKRAEIKRKKRLERIRRKKEKERLRKLRSKKPTKFEKYDSKEKHLYYDNTTKVKGVCFYDDMFFAFDKKGDYVKDLTAKLRRATKTGKSAKILLGLLGEPVKTVSQPSCYGEGYEDMIYEYPLLSVATLKNTSQGTEILNGIDSKY